MSVEYWVELDDKCQAQAQQAAKGFREAWGWGGPNGQRRVKRFAEWFEDLVDNALALEEAQQMTEDCDNAMLYCCCEILALELDEEAYELTIPHIIRLREALRPNWDWDDWPYDISEIGQEEEEDDEVFHLEL